MIYTRLHRETLKKNTIVCEVNRSTQTNRALEEV